MSGVELAGLVLAVLPLVISALEDYNDGLDPVKAFVKWENYLPQYIRKLRNQHVHYEQTLRLLLAPITTEYELAEMIAEPHGDLWRDPTMAEKLRYKLDESYDAYHHTIKDIEKIMTTIAEKLDLERATSITRNDLEAMLLAHGQPKVAQKFEFRKRVKFSMNKKKVKRLLEELDECNKELERFTEKSERLEPYRKSSKPSIAQKLQKIQTLRGAYPVPLNGLRLSRKAETVTLEEILKDGTKIRLSKKDRYTLAVTVASSILQLHASPWVSDNWSKRDIMFYHTISAHRSIDIETPYVSQKLMPLPGSVKPIGFSSKNTTLLALGITLLELYFGKPCEQQMPENLYMGPDKSLALLCTAHHWYESEQEDLSAAFQGAIAHCLRCFADPSGSLQDPDFLQAAMEQIVLPLQDELYQFLGTR
ncbi:uncharacterized protein LTHEOB_279 [Lasiodiplodia theobromae]|uniref:DUF7580 domain-containing protein n=1 Tax=Lasiodiplodia theobromae TaxID=45133 RepID=A0A5N5DJ19_9PEZI|nr:uncharacterized protein LTHEOB_279 [Lasiodiplodia theobromae]KAB2576942.1 hypothetical protein DBV05_g4415 [Lasiodiplodia theobromae]KAF4543580.1 hypothetical protein LTHEOB_279 [Lasiodiplodia theobromae]